MENVTLPNILAVVGWVLGGVILLNNGCKAILDIITAFKAPNVAQDTRLCKIEAHMEEIDSFLAADKRRLDAVDSDSKCTQRALLALLDHALDGNNVKQMEDAKQDIITNLINK